jgi:hypothetical protein
MAETQHDTDPAIDDDALIARVRVIEDQPLEERAAAFAQLHDELRHALEGDATAQHA